MELVTIDSQRILVDLEPGDCLLLATLCRHALEHAAAAWSHTAKPAPAFPRPEHVGALVAAFEAMAMAYAASSFAHGGTMDDDYTLEHIRREWNPLRDVAARPAHPAAEEAAPCAS